MDVYVYRSIESAEHEAGVIFGKDIDRAQVAWVIEPMWGVTPADMEVEIAALTARGVIEVAHEITPHPVQWEDGRPYDGLVGWVVGMIG